MERAPKRIVYVPAILDIISPENIRALNYSRTLGDFHVCGLLSDASVKDARRPSLFGYERRLDLARSLNLFNRVMKQDGADATENLRKLKEEFADANIVLVKSPEWKEFPELDYLRTVGGTVARNTSHVSMPKAKLLGAFLSSKMRELKQKYFPVRKQSFSISTKANTLQALKQYLNGAKIEDMLVFTVTDWTKSKEKILQDIKNKFRAKTVVVRSSAINEDAKKSSMAGYFYSELGVAAENKNHVEAAANRVIDSYSKAGFVSNLNQVLVQKQSENIAISGVLFTADLAYGRQYYVINYDDATGLTDTVTKGVENKVIRISKFCGEGAWPAKFNKLMRIAKQIESLVPDIDLDIEFGIDSKGTVILFQVRQLLAAPEFQTHNEIASLKEEFRGLASPKQHLEPEFTYFSDMSDWNPAEMIGDAPSTLAYSLYDYMITDSVWNRARASQKYYDVAPAKLVVLLGNKPYVDVRSTFNSFTPANISRELRKKLVSFYLEKLKAHPELHDKVEFEVVSTCYDVAFNEKSKELLRAGLDKNEVETFRLALIDLTNELVFLDSIARDLAKCGQMEQVRSRIKEEARKSHAPAELIHFAFELLNDAKEKGTLPFARLARQAFVGKIILKSLVVSRTLTKEEYDCFLESIRTVATHMAEDFDLFYSGQISVGTFLNKYGHLRPGTYDITNLRYDKNPDLLKTSGRAGIAIKKKHMAMPVGAITKIFEEHGLHASGEYFLRFAEEALQAREFSKFEFTKNISDALELFAEAGAMLGFTRPDMSFLDVATLKEAECLSSEEIKSLWARKISENKEWREKYSHIALPPIVFSEIDFDIVQCLSAKPNFITAKTVDAECAHVTSTGVPVDGKIVIIENADPGYDWLFAKGIKGMITKHGGVASHMSIRCAEFGLPAAIGCGETLFEGLKKAKRIRLDCNAGRIEIY